MLSRGLGATMHTIQWRKQLHPALICIFNLYAHIDEVWRSEEHWMTCTRKWERETQNDYTITMATRWVDSCDILSSLKKKKLKTISNHILWNWYQAWSVFTSIIYLETYTGHLLLRSDKQETVKSLGPCPTFVNAVTHTHPNDDITMAFSTCKLQ